MILAQLQETVQASRHLSEMGVVGVLIFFLLFLLLGIAFAVRYALKRLFDQGDGVVVKMADSHIKFLASLEASFKGIETAVQEQEKTSKKIDSTVSKIHLALNTHQIDLDKIRRIWKYHINFLRKTATVSGFLEQVSSDLDRMEKMVDDC